MKAIETLYKGYRFRSRLEARWAVFFDALGLTWEYESQGYELDTGDRYLPDFWFPKNELTDEGYWIEIKPHRNLSAREYRVAFELSRVHPGYILFGTPELPRYTGPRSDQEPVKLIPDGFIPFTPDGAPMPQWQFYTGSWAMCFGIVEQGDHDKTWVRTVLRLECWHERIHHGSFDLWPVPSFEPLLLAEYNTGDPLKAGTKKIDSPRLRTAYEAARSARFEHGEQGRKK